MSVTELKEALPPVLRKGKITQRPISGFYK